jgi:nucleotide-binding universal stress UspA family protein
MRAINVILVPTDFSAASGRAVAYACTLADACGASLHLLHVIEDPFAGGTYMGMMSAPPEGYFEQLDLHSRMRLQSLLTEEQQRRYTLMAATRMGSAAAEIVDYARNHPAIDLIVIATAGRGAVARLMMGSVTAKVMRTAPCPAPCPVLTVHAHDRTDAVAADRAA